MSLSQTREDILRDIVISIDGPSASGKTTTARGVARSLRLRHVDTGAMYRAITLKAVEAGVDLQDPGAVGRIARAVRIDFTEGVNGQSIVLDGEDVTKAIRSPDISSRVSVVSAHADVRRSMVRRQRALADRGGVVLEGRDIGSVVLPSAQVKIYLDASIDERAGRRLRELRDRGADTELDAVRAALVERDHHDSTREASPLKIPIGARVIDTSKLTIDQQVQEVIATAESVGERILDLVDQSGEMARVRKRKRLFYAGQLLFYTIARLVWGLRVIRKEDYDYTENYIYACNHRSNADPPLVGSTIRRNLFFLAKRALFKIGLFGRLLLAVNVIPIRRAVFDRVALDSCLAVLDRGDSLLIFPEGGRSKDTQLCPAKPGVGFLALTSGKAVWPLYVEGTLSLKWSLFRKPRMTVIHGRPIRMTDTDLSKYQEAGDFREFGIMVMCAIQALQDELHHPPTRGR